jgi:hypothetical protein
MNRDEILEIYRECGVRFASRWDGTGTKAEERLIAAASRIESLVREESMDMMLVPKKPTREMMEAWFRAYDEQQWNANSWESAFDVAYTAMFAAAIRKSEG